jgi:hypothetical protein
MLPPPSYHPLALTHPIAIWLIILYHGVQALAFEVTMSDNSTTLSGLTLVRKELFSLA